MKDVISKVTFGFLMAQLVPGAVAMMGVTMLHAAAAAHFTAGAGTPTSIVGLLEDSVARWNGSVLGQLSLIGLCAGAGMLIHGLHWSVLGFLESGGKPVSESFWHKLPVGLQILLGPVKIIVEALLFFIKGTDIRNIAMEENVPHLSKDQLEAFNFLQDFYLHFAQFYAHTSYALVIVTAGLLALEAVMGLTLHSVVSAVLAYLLAGLFFVIGRIQLTSLFKAERAIVGNALER